MNRQLTIILRILFAIGLVLLWQYAVQSNPTTTAVPPPSAVVSAGLELLQEGAFYEAIFATLSRLVIGLSLAMLAGVAFGLLAATIRSLYNVIALPIDIVRSIPPIAWTPLAIVWFGLGNLPAIFIVFLGAFFPLLVAVTNSISSIDTGYLRAAKLMGATRWQVARHVILPAALPIFFVGLKTAIVVAWFNVIAAELIGVSSGLGYLIQLNRILLFDNVVLFLVLFVGFLGYLAAIIVDNIERIVIPWHSPERTRGWQLRINRVLAKLMATWRTAEMPAHSFHKRIAESSEALSFRELSVSFKLPNGERLDVLAGINLAVKPGEICGIMGKNGTGKTTLLNVAAGFEKKYSGTVRWNNKPDFDNQRIGYIFQQSFAYPWYTVRENLLIACLFRGASCDGLDQNLKAWGLSDFGDAFPTQLSGGMQQKLSIIRTLSLAPEILLLDEPLTNLDIITKLEVIRTLKQYVDINKPGVLWVTHDLEEAIQCCNRVLVLGGRGHPPLALIELDAAKDDPEKGGKARQSLLEFVTATDR